MNTVPDSNSTSEQDDEPRIRHDFIVTLSGYGSDAEEAFSDALKSIENSSPYYDDYTSDPSDVGLTDPVDVDLTTNTGYCKDCQYWESHNNLHWQTCNLPVWANYSDDIGEDNMAMYVNANDDTGLEYDLKTGPMFGCVKFKPRS